MMILTSSVLSLGIVFPHLVLPAAVGSAVVTMHRGFVGDCKVPPTHPPTQCKGPTGVMIGGATNLPPLPLPGTHRDLTILCSTY